MVQVCQIFRHKENLGCTWWFKGQIEKKPQLYAYKRSWLFEWWLLSSKCRPGYKGDICSLMELLRNTDLQCLKFDFLIQASTHTSSDSRILVQDLLGKRTYQNDKAYPWIHLYCPREGKMTEWEIWIPFAPILNGSFTEIRKEIYY